MEKPRLQQRYEEVVVPALMKRFGYKSIMQVPRLEKIVVNMGVGEAVADRKVLDEAVEQLALITGQRPMITKAKKSISNFKLREGMPIGCKVTLRGARMYEFFDRLVTLALPRVRDFRGVSDRSFDGRGNYSLGIREQIVFPEIDIDKVSRILGMDITFVTTARTDEEAYELLKELGMPFRRREGQTATATAA
jgi:large subunit ribosomal protein L5|nr:MAG: 50S ribosomal protein L5 [Bacteroidota bacterium]